MRRTVFGVIVVGCLLAGAPGALAQGTSDPLVRPYQADDAKGFHDVLPPGANGLVNGPQLAAFLGTGARPPHSNDQLPLYAGLRSATPGLNAADLEKFFKDSSFGIKPDDV